MFIVSMQCNSFIFHLLSKSRIGVQYTATEVTDAKAAINFMQLVRGRGHLYFCKFVRTHTVYVHASSDVSGRQTYKLCIE